RRFAARAGSAGLPRRGRALRSGREGGALPDAWLRRGAYVRSLAAGGLALRCGGRIVHSKRRHLDQDEIRSRIRRPDEDLVDEFVAPNLLLKELQELAG